jgi:isopentenyldiphosphate isomerase
MSGRIAVVDAATNRFVRWEERRTIHEQQLVHRSIHVLVFDRADRLLVQRRHAQKQTYPRYWDTSCAGHVEESDYTAGGPDADLDRVYEDVARRELHEELGIVVPVAPIARIGPIAGVHYEWIALYRAISDGPFVLQPDEVEEIRFVTRAELAAITPQTDTLRWLAATYAWPSPSRPVDP